MTAKKFPSLKNLPEIEKLLNTTWTIEIPKKIDKPTGEVSSITITEKPSIRAFLQQWMNYAKTGERTAVVVPEHMAAWTQLQWYGAFASIIGKMNLAGANPIDWNGLEAALREWELFAAIARAAGHEISVDYDHQFPELVGVVPTGFGFNYVSPLAERTVDERYALICEAITASHGGDSVVPGFVATAMTHEDLDRLIHEYELEGDLGRWIIHTSPDKESRDAA